MQLFELKIGEQVIPLKWGTYAMKLYTDRTKSSIDDFFNIIERMAKTGSGETIENPVTQHEVFVFIENTIHAGYRAANKQHIDEESVCDWIDACGGVGNLATGQLMEYLNYVIRLTFAGYTPLPSAGEEKKSEVTEPGTTS